MVLYCKQIGGCGSSSTLDQGTIIVCACIIIYNFTIIEKQESFRLGKLEFALWAAQVMQQHLKMPTGVADLVAVFLSSILQHKTTHNSKIYATSTSRTGTGKFQLLNFWSNTTGVRNTTHFDGTQNTPRWQQFHVAPAKRVLFKYTTLVD